MESNYNIFEDVVSEVGRNGCLGNIEPQDITEDINFEFDDDKISKSVCKLIAYNIHVNEDDDSEAYNPKKNPDKAIDIVFDYPNDNLKIEVFLDTNTLEWDSCINESEKLSPEQMSTFFKTNFYQKLCSKLNGVWPSEDALFSSLLNALKVKKYKIDYAETKPLDEDSNVFRKGNIDTEKSREKNAAGKQIRTRSGRKIITPSNFDVRHDENEAYYCWPDQKGKGEFKWANWADYKKIKPVARIRFRLGQFVYGISFSCIVEDDPNRGAKAYNLDLEPKLQYLTPEETQEMMKLTIVQKFLRHASKRMIRYLSLPDEEIMSKISNPDKCTIDDIRRTKHVLKNTLKAIKNARHDTYIYT